MVSTALNLIWEDQIEKIEGFFHEDKHLEANDTLVELMESVKAGKCV
jgi:hypothetical protein